jgi:hypothetical protein
MRGPDPGLRLARSSSHRHSGMDVVVPHYVVPGYGGLRARWCAGTCVAALPPMPLMLPGSPSARGASRPPPAVQLGAYGVCDSVGSPSQAARAVQLPGVPCSRARMIYCLALERTRDHARAFEAGQRCLARLGGEAGAKDSFHMEGEARAKRTAAGRSRHRGLPPRRRRAAARKGSCYGQRGAAPPRVPLSACGGAASCLRQDGPAPSTLSAAACGVPEPSGSDPQGKLGEDEAASCSSCRLLQDDSALQLATAPCDSAARDDCQRDAANGARHATLGSHQRLSTEQPGPSPAVATAAGSSAVVSPSAQPGCHGTIDVVAVSASSPSQGAPSPVSTTRSELSPSFQPVALPVAAEPFGESADEHGHPPQLPRRPTYAMWALGVFEQRMTAHGITAQPPLPEEATPRDLGEGAAPHDDAVEGPSRSSPLSSSLPPPLAPASGASHELRTFVEGAHDGPAAGRAPSHYLAPRGRPRCPFSPPRRVGTRVAAGL